MNNSGTDSRFLNVSGVMADLLATARADALALRAGGRTPTAGGHLLDGREIRQFPKFVFHRKGATS